MKNEDQNDTVSPEKRWKSIAKYVVGGTAIAGAAVVVTLAATHSGAQRANLIAYLRGQAEGLKQGGWLDGWNAAEAWFAENGIEELTAGFA